MTEEAAEEVKVDDAPPPDPTVESVRKENEALRTELYMRSAVYEVEQQLAKAGARSPRLLADQARSSFQFDDDGNLVNVRAVVEHFRTAFPEQFGRDQPTGSIDGGSGRPATPGLTAEGLSRMSAAEIQRLDWAEVSTVLAN